MKTVDVSAALLSVNSLMEAVRLELDETQKTLEHLAKAMEGGKERLRLLNVDLDTLEWLKQELRRKQGGEAEVLTVLQMEIE